MEAPTSIDGNTGYFPSFEVLTNSKMESVVGNAINSCISSAQQEQNSFDAGLSEAQDALLSMIEQQSNRSPDEYRSALVPFGDILRDIYETSNQTLNMSQQQQQHNDVQPTANFISESANNINQQQILPTNFNVQTSYQQPSQQLQMQQNNQGFPTNYNNTNLMNYLNPFNNSFNFYQNYQQQQSNSIYPGISAVTNSQINNNNSNENHIQKSKYDDYNKNIETLIETVYEDENDQNPVYLNFNVSQNGNAATAAVVDNPNENHIPIQNTNYPVEQIIYPSVYQTQQQQQQQHISLNSNNNINPHNGKLWYPESMNGNCNNNINENPVNRNINQQNYINNHQQEYRIQNNTNLPIRKLLHSNQSAFDVYHSRNGIKTPYQKYNKNKTFIDTTINYHDSINNNYLIKSKNYHHHPYINEQQQQQFIPIGRNLQLQPNQKFITSDMISYRPPIKTKLTVVNAITVNKNQSQQQQPQQQPQLPPPPPPTVIISPISTTTPLSSTSSSTTTTETCNANSTDIGGNGVIIKELTNVDISGIDFSSLDTSDIIISKIEPKFGEPLHKKRKQDLKILEGSDNIVFEFIDMRPIQSHQNDDNNDNKLLNDPIDDIQIEKNLKTILNSSYTDDEQDDDNLNNNNLNNNNNNNYQLNIVKTSTPNLDEIPLSKLKVKKNKINKENLKLPSTSSSSPSSSIQQQPITNNIPYKKQKRTLLKNSKIECCFDNHDDETSSSDSDFEEFILKNKSFKCHKCNKIFKSAKTLSTHRKRCNNIIEQKNLDQDKIDNINKKTDSQQQQQHQIKNNISSGFDSEHDDDPNSYPIEYLESDTEVNYIKNQNVVTNIIGNKNTNTNNNNNIIEDPQEIVKETIEIDLENNEECFRRKTRSQTKRKNVDLNYYEPSQKLPVKRKK